MKQLLMAGLSLLLAGTAGCTKHLPPQEELQRAVQQSFDSSGYNYRSQSRITRLSLPKVDALAAAAPDKKLQYGRAALDLVRSFSVAVEGAVDQRGKRAEASYDLRYQKDNMEISIRLPLLIDYTTQTVYFGPSFLHTLLAIVAPAAEPDGKELLLALNLGDLLRQEAATSPALAKLSVEERLEALNLDIFNTAMKDAVSNALTKLPPARFADLPLTDEDRHAGVERSIRLQLGHEETVTVLAVLIEGITRALGQQGVISEEELTVLQTLTERATIDKLVASLDLSLVQTIGIGSPGVVRAMNSQVHVADREGGILIDLENVSRFDRYGAPKFTINPAASKVLDFTSVLNTLKELKPVKPETPPAPPGTDDRGEEEKGG